jgi:protein TonB
MNFSKLSFKLPGLVAALTITTLITACNDNTGTANNSTTVPDSSTKDMAGNSSPMPAKPVRKGKATASMKSDDQTVKMEKDRMGYYNRTEVAPAYNGSLESYIDNNIEYPQEAVDNNVEGTVYVRFGVDENGNISHVSTLGKKIGYGLEEEAVKAVSNMPKWTPGQVKGKTVRTWRTLPITYKIES